ncbi:MAG: hypothetical protein L0227_06035 [Chloroflexi bacterium]|nr:hypothetical protein [Chloroflexota bacterium]
MSDDAPFAADPFDEDPLRGFDLEDALAVEALMGWDGVSCATCRRPLGTDPEDELDGDAGRPICGECNRARSFDALEGA